MRRYLLGYFVSVGLWSCQPSVQKPLAARYKDRHLTREEALQRVVLTERADTTALIRAYAMEWIREQALADTAYALLPALRTQIEAQVQDYRNKLLVLHLSRLLLEEGSYVEVSDSEMQAFYQAQAQAFRAMEPLYRWRWVQVPVTWAAQWEVRQKLSLPDSAWLEWLQQKKYPGGVQPDWSPRIDSLQPYFPVRLSELPVYGSTQVQRLEGTQAYWLVFQLTGKIFPGQILPYELAREQIRRIFTHRAAEARIDSFQQIVYQKALAHPDVHLY